MNLIDATCIRCGKPMRWLIGSPRICCDAQRVHPPLSAATVAPTDPEAAEMGRAAWEQQMAVARNVTPPASEG